MRRLGSLQVRLALAVGFGVAILWVITSLITASTIRGEVNETFDSALAESAQRILPLAIHDVFERQDEESEQLIDTLGANEGTQSYVVRDKAGKVLLRSQDAQVVSFPPFEHAGFIQTRTHRLYYEEVLGGEFNIAVAEPLDHREEVAYETLVALGLPLLVLLPLTLGTIWYLVRLMLRPLRGLRAQLSTRDGNDLTPLDTEGLPNEITPVADSVNAVLARLQRTLEAERSFASNAAHELRTPVAAALVQTQRLMAETGEDHTKKRAQDIEFSLKRLNRMSERLMQMARAEGASLRTGSTVDLVVVLKMVADELSYADDKKQLVLDLPAQPVMSNIDADIFAILVRNLLENALRHGDNNAPINVLLRLNANARPGITLHVDNEGPVVPEEVLQNLTHRFFRDHTNSEGSGLGLAIVNTIVQGIGGSIEAVSPASNHADGFEINLYFDDM